MPTRKRSTETPADPPTEKSAARSDSGPASATSRTPARGDDDVPAQVDLLASQRAYNADKAAEHGEENGINPVEGEHYAPPSDAVGGSTTSERNVGDIADLLAAKYAAPREAILADVVVMLQDLADKGFLTEAREKTS